MIDKEVLRHVQGDPQCKDFCKEHNDLTHVAPIFCQTCLSDHISSLILAGIEQYNRNQALEAQLIKKNCCPKCFLPIKFPNGRYGGYPLDLCKCKGEVNDD